MHKTIYYYTGCKYKIKVAKLNWSALTFCWALGQAPVVWFSLAPYMSDSSYPPCRHLWTIKHNWNEKSWQRIQSEILTINKMSNTWHYDNLLFCGSGTVFLCCSSWKFYLVTSILLKKHINCSHLFSRNGSYQREIGWKICHIMQEMDWKSVATGIIKLWKQIWNFWFIISIYDNSYILMLRREGQQCLQTAVQHCEGSVVVWIYISASVKTDGVMNTKK